MLAGMCEATPSAERELPVSSEAPAMARDFLRTAHCSTHHSSVLDDAVLLVSELVTNSVLHGGPPVVVEVDCDGNVLQVRVRDGSPELPNHRQAGQTDESGRGLALVDTLSSAWGVDSADKGKHVWFMLRR
jgi:anti-sigma regulatory factor (Ser/Thr protein kinase)